MWRIGHRGACGHAPENTIASISKAIELGCDGVEFDIQLSKDNIPVVIHDNTLERTTNGKGLVSDYTLEELQKFDAGNSDFRGEKIPSLSDVINLVDGRTRLFIELKAEKSVKPVIEVISHAVEKLGWNLDKFFILSFDHSQIIEAKKYLPILHTSALFVGIPITLAQIAVEAEAWSINPCIHHLNKELVDDAHAKGLKVLVWTVDKPAEINRAKALGVDGMFSNFPDRL